MLYWQHWTREPLSAQRLTKAVMQAAQACLLPAQPAGAALPDLAHDSTR
jgi:hypothetical protein